MLIYGQKPWKSMPELPYLKMSALEFCDMHLKLKDFEFLIDFNCQNSWDKILICTELWTFLQPHTKTFFQLCMCILTSEVGDKVMLIR